MAFPFYHQRDAMDCGPACLMMAAAAHGQKYPLTVLRERSYLGREGVSAQGIMEWVADPAAGKFQLSRADFEKAWASDAGQGVLILLEPTPRFLSTT